MAERETEVVQEWVDELQKAAGLDQDPDEITLWPRTWSEFDQKELPEEEWIIRNMIPRQGITIIASGSGEKKTWIALDMSRCIAKGTDFLSNASFKTHQAKVLYVDEEMPESLLQKRGRLLSLPDTGENLILINASGINLNIDKHFEVLQKYILTNEFKVVFLDTLRAVASGLDEDRAKEVRVFFKRLQSLRNLGVSIVLLDHTRKPAHFDGKHSKKEQLLGSQDKVASIDNLLMIKSEAGSSEIRVYHKKNRFGIEVDPFTIEMVDTLDEEVQTKRVELKYVGGIEEKQHKLDEAKNPILDLLADGGQTRKDIIAIISASENIGQKNISNAIRSLEITKEIKSEWKGREKFYELSTSYSDFEDDSLQIPLST